MPGPAYKYLYHKLARQPQRWHPMLSVVYLTYACDFRCPYCSDGAQNPYYKLRSPVLPADRMLELLRNVRRYCDHVVLTGGEPVKHPAFSSIMERLPALDFHGVVLTTNGYELAPHLPSVVRAVSELVFSVDTLDHEKADRWHGVGPGTLAAILQTIDEADRIKPRDCRIVISAVATPDNLEDLFEVYRWACERGFTFAACPQLLGVKAHPALHNSERYKDLFNLLIREKRAGRPVFGTLPYLHRMSELSSFRCKPLTMLVVSPTGEVFYPCLERGTSCGNLLDTPNLHALLQHGSSTHGPLPSCGVQCHSACALGFATVIEKPWALIQEVWFALRA